eukprot:m.408298 g.408298  ORF g.408298 m.408298 type:complete len:269 (-) comp20145_c8_seq17:137-943(-)
MGGKSSKSKKENSTSALDAEAAAGAGAKSNPKEKGSPKKKESPKKKDKKKDQSPAKTNGEVSDAGNKDGAAKVVPKSVASRLMTKAAQEGKIEGEGSEDQPKSKMFEAKKESRSKIFQALNPETLAYQSRREKEEQEVVKVSIRGGGDYGRTYAGEEIEYASGEEDEEEDFDPNNLPDFGEFQEEMDELRRGRAEKQKAHQEELRKKWEAKQAAEQARIDRELAAIEKKEAARSAQLVENIDGFVEQAQKRVEEETADLLKQWSFKQR